MRNIDHGVAFERLLRPFLLQPLQILEVGAGTGLLSPDRRYRQAFITGLDPDPRVKNNPHIDRACVATLEKAQFPPERFDVICCRFVFEHLADPAAALNILHDWLKPGGTLLILTVNALHYYCWLGKHIPQRWAESITGRKETDIFPTYYRFNNPLTLKHIIHRSRFSSAAKISLFLCEKYLYAGPLWMRAAAAAYSLIVNSCPAFRLLRAGLIVKIDKVR